MRQSTRLLGLFLMAVGVLSWAAGAPESRPAAAAEVVIPFKVVQLFIEYNSTDDDAGMQAFFDAEAWKEVKIFSHDGRMILEIDAKRGLKQLGLTEVRFESDEPALSEVLARFPAGAYTFAGKTIDGNTLQGTATLSHDIPAAPVFSPTNGALVDRNNAVITWNPIPGIGSYQVIVGNADLGVSMTVDLPASVTSLQVPPTFLAPDTEYAIEVLAIAATGNRTITEGTFKTLP